MADNIIDFKHTNASSLGKVRLLDAFCEMTNRNCGLTGHIRGYDRKNPDIVLIDIGEMYPVPVHRTHFALIA